MPSGRWGARMGDAAMVDMMLAALHDPFDNIHMGETAENLAESRQITRREQDAAGGRERTAVRRARSRTATSSSRSCRSS